MKVFLDLTKLLNEGKITQKEFDKLSQLSLQSTGSLAFNLFVGLGVAAVVCATFGLLPTPFTAIVLGALLSGIGLALLTNSKNWILLGRICLPIGALLLGGGILWLYEGSIASWLVVTILLLVGSLVARHGLLMALAVLSLSATVGASTSYYHATYGLSIEQPTLTVVIFSLVGYFAYWISLRVDAVYERLAIIASRTAVFLVNFGFWIGSLWGDTLPHDTIIPDWAFALAWAIALLLAGIWSVQTDRRWLLNVVAVFAAIHFYTQWFERLGASPGTLLIAGLLALLFALGLKQLNAHFNRIAKTKRK